MKKLKAYLAKRRAYRQSLDKLVAAQQFEESHGACGICGFPHLRNDEHYPDQPWRNQ